MTQSGRPDPAAAGTPAAPTIPAGGLAADPRVLIGTVFVTFTVAVASTTSGAVAQPEIADAFGAGAADVGAIVFGYSTAFAIMTAVYGSLARRFGLGRCLTVGVLLVAIGSVVAVVAVDLWMVIAGRVVSGLGAGAIPTLSMALIARRLDGPARARALGINVAAVGMGFAVGPLAGGLLLETFGWRGALALGLFVAPAALVFPRLAPEPGDPRAPLDLPGIALLAAGVGGLVLIVNRLPVLGIGPLTATMLVVTGALLAFLVLRSRRRVEPALPIAELRDPVLRRAMLLGMIGQTGFFGVLILAPIVAARVHGIDGFGLGLLLLPMAILIGLISPRNGRLAARIGRRATTAVSLAVIGAGTGFLALVGPEASLPLLVVGLLTAGAGFGLLSAPLVGEVSRRFPDARRPVALGAYNLAFFIGSASGAAIATGFVQSRSDLAIFSGRALPGASTGLLVLAVLPLAALAFDLLRPLDTEATIPAWPQGGGARPAG